MKHLPFSRASRLLSAALFLAPSLHAAIKLPSLIGDNMILQAEAKANVWGWADPGEKVTVTFEGKTAQASAGADGKWQARLENLKSGTTGDLTIAGTNTVTLKNVVAGEVWVASGQSNMEFRVAGSLNAQTEIAAANFPAIRMFNLKRAAKGEPQDNCEGQWQVCSPQTVGGFSAVGYFFARRLHETLKQPVGVIHTSWGGTPAEFWTPTPIIVGTPDFKHIADAWQQTIANYPKAKEAYDKAMQEWKAAVEQAKTDGKAAPRQPNAPRGGDAFGGPGCLYNGMIAPVLPYTIQGAIWYQGESNASAAALYRKLFPTMILSWRMAWAKAGLAGSDRPDFPFLFVQLANYIPANSDPARSEWAELREAQLQTLELPRTGMAVAIDIGEAGDIHPKNKQEVGRRLALCAEATVYYRDQEYSGPLFGGSQIEEGKLRLSFRNANGMKAKDDGPVKGFTIAGEDRVFHAADAEIQGDHVILSSKEVPKPVAVRYAWADNPECNLINEAGLPASPFRTDDWSSRP
ncbi:MAG TPA: sialate O-acetylesterase [Chthoniobacteraceae bacterium]|jgi:sialate O-acetylesterase|nr:sialate O-acetylesterase [Chthoniobacteraceae bacterium]